LDPVRPESHQPCLEKPKTFLDAKQDQPAIKFQFTFPVEVKLQDDVASVTSSQFCFVAPFKPGCSHVYSRGVQVPPTNSISNHLETECILYCRTKWPFGTSGNSPDCLLSTPEHYVTKVQSKKKGHSRCRLEKKNYHTI